MLASAQTAAQPSAQPSAESGLSWSVTPPPLPQRRTSAPPDAAATDPGMTVTQAAAPDRPPGAPSWTPPLPGRRPSTPDRIATPDQPDAAARPNGPAVAIVPPPQPDVGDALPPPGPPPGPPSGAGPASPLPEAVPAPEPPQLGDAAPPPPPDILTTRPPDPQPPDPQPPSTPAPSTASPPPTEFAAIPPEVPPSGDAATIPFGGATADLPSDAQPVLDGVARRMVEDAGTRLMVRSYAGGTPEAAAQARRLSLNRALAVRRYLVERGVRGTRIDIRALGNMAPDDPRDRIDLTLSTRN